MKNEIYMQFKDLNIAKEALETFQNYGPKCCSDVRLQKKIDAELYRLVIVVSGPKVYAKFCELLWNGAVKFGEIKCSIYNRIGGVA